jgi:hypothetical protein
MIGTLRRELLDRCRRHGTPAGWSARGRCCGAVPGAPCRGL